MKKLLQICVEGNRGSTGRIAEDIGNLIISKGWESYIAFGRYPKPSNSKLIRIGNFLDIFLHVLLTRFFDDHGFGSIRSTKKLLKVIDNIKPDIVHLHHIHGYYINIELLFDYLRSIKVPVVWTFHDCWSFTGHCAYFTYADCYKWEQNCNNCPQKSEYPTSIFVDNSYNNFLIKKKIFTSLSERLTIVSVSNWLNNLVERSFFKNQDKRVIYNGIDLNIFKPIDCNKVLEKHRIGNRKVILGVANPWSNRKGLFDFIKLNELLDDRYVIILVGLNNRQIEMLPTNIIGVNKTDSQQELNEYYNVADVFLNLSMEETFGLTTAESLAAGTPVIVYNNSASPELINGDIGIAINPKNFKEILDAVVFFTSGNEKQYQISCNNFIREKFNKIDCYENYYSLYLEKIVNKKE